MCASGMEFVGNPFNWKWNTFSVIQTTITSFKINRTNVHTSINTQRIHVEMHVKCERQKKEHSYEFFICHRSKSHWTHVCLSVAVLFTFFFILLDCCRQINNSMRVNVYTRISPKTELFFCYLSNPQCSLFDKGHSGRFIFLYLLQLEWVGPVHMKTIDVQVLDSRQWLSCHFEFRMLEHFSHNQPKTLEHLNFGE